METLTWTQEERLRYAEVLVEIGQLHRAEREVAEVLDENPEHLEALSLFTKIKHMRGQLSLAVACSIQLQSKQSAGGQARMHLESMLHLAQDPSQGAGEFLTLGQYQLVQKPTAYLALEEAFRRFVTRRPNEASATCRQVANRYHDRDPEVYKLAVLAESWIYELSGNLPLATEILERLGLERGFETDTDRLQALVTLYDKSGARGALEAELNILKYLESTFDGTETLGRLSVLYRRLGNAEAATEYEQRHLAAYLREKHRLSFEQVVRIAAKHFIPLEKLRTIRFIPTGPPSAMTAPREEAIARAMRDDLEGARKLLAAGTDLLDIKYQANLEAISGDERREEQAEALYVRALRDDPGDLPVIAWLLDRWKKHKSRAIAAAFREDSILAPVLETLEHAVHDAPGDPRLWRRLETLFSLREGDHPQTRQFADRAAALERSSKERAQGIGRVFSAAAYRFAGRITGLIHEVWATREMTTPGQGGALRRDDILGNLTTEMRENVRSTFLAAREYAQAKFPHLTRDILNYNYGYKVTKEDEPSGGTSAGLPTALAFLSVFIQRPVSQDLASTGMLVTDAHDVLTVRAVGDIEYKVDGAYHRNLKSIIVPTGTRPILEHSGIVPRAIRDELVRYVADLDEVVGLVFEGTADF